MTNPKLFGVVNLTEDSFSDGGRYLDPTAAIAHALRLVEAGADVIDLGAAASNVDARPVGAEEELHRLAPVIAALVDAGVAISVDSFQAETQRRAIAHGVAYLNDIEGFADPSLYPDLARAHCRLVVMHAIHGRGRAQHVNIEPGAVWQHMHGFFDRRVAALVHAGITRDRLILDPGMGFFLGDRPASSLRALAGLPRLKQRFGLPILVSVSRKSFLAAVTGRGDPAERGAATLAAELYAAANGADFIRTHDPGALRDGLRVMAAINEEKVRLSEEERD